MSEDTTVNLDLKDFMGYHEPKSSQDRRDPYYDV